MLAASAAGSSMAMAAGPKPALLGGIKTRAARWPTWPVWDKTDEEAILGALRSSRWYRVGGTKVDAFETQYASLTGAPHCLATANGTSALLTSMAAMGIGAGDEVVIPAYTFVATVNAVMMLNALPVFADTDMDSFQVDARSMASRVTSQTTLLMPVHMAGAAADLDAILEVGKQKKVPVLEDACQAHLGEWRGRNLGTWGAAGCFSFQASKNLNSGEGGAILTASSDLVERAYAFHNNSNRRKVDAPFDGRGLNLRMTEFQGALLVSQMARIEEFAKRRDDNAKYLDSMLRQIPGINPQKNHEGCTRSAWHLFMLRYDSGPFNGLPRAKFLKALQAEGITCSSGYTPLNKSESVVRALATKSYQRVFGKTVLEEWTDRNHCPQNDKLCEQAVWFTQNMLIGSRADMEQIAEAVKKIQTWSRDLAKG